MPGQWQARKWRDVQRLPAMSLAPAVGTVPDFDPGHTFVVHELVRLEILLPYRAPKRFDRKGPDEEEGKLAYILPQISEGVPLLKAITWKPQPEPIASNA